MDIDLHTVNLALLRPIILVGRAIAAGTDDIFHAAKFIFDRDDTGIAASISNLRGVLNRQARASILGQYSTLFNFFPANHWS